MRNTMPSSVGVGHGREQRTCGVLGRVRRRRRGRTARRCRSRSSARDHRACPSRSPRTARRFRRCRARPRGTPPRARRARGPTAGRSATPSRSRAAMRRSSRRFHRRSRRHRRASPIGEPSERGRSSTVRSCAKSSASRSGSSSSRRRRRPTTANATRTRARRSRRARSGVRRARSARSGCASTARDSNVRGGRARRPSDRWPSTSAARLERHRPRRPSGSVAYPGWHAPPPHCRRATQPGRRRSRRQRRRASSRPTSGPRPPGCDLVAFPELALTGYPPEDLLLRPSFVAAGGEVLEKFAARTGRTGRGRRLPRARRDSTTRPRCAPTVACRASTASTCCPTTRCSTSSATSCRPPSTGRCSSSAGVRVAVSICEDAWSPNGPIITQAAGGAELVVNINASPYYAGRIHERETMLATRAADASVPVLYVNLVGGQDELVFDGASMLFDEGGHLVARAGSSRKTSSSSTSTCVPRSVAACSTRGAVHAPATARGDGQRAAPGRAPRAPRRRAAARAGARGLRGAGARHPRLRAEERGHRRVRRDLRRHRLVARRRHRGRRARPRARHRRAHAVALLERGQHHRRRRARRRTSASAR